jgi:hypothetical protein
MDAEQVACTATGPDWCIVLIAVIALLLITGVAVIGYRLIAAYRKKTEIS